MSDEALNPEEGKIIPMNICHVNESCIGCWTCVALAPDLFAMEGGHANVTKQPESQGEVASYKVAQSSCPVAAIIGEAKELKQAA